MTRGSRTVCGGCGDSRCGLEHAAQRQLSSTSIADSKRAMDCGPRAISSRCAVCLRGGWCAGRVVLGRAHGGPHRVRLECRFARADADRTLCKVRGARRLRWVRSPGHTDLVCSARAGCARAGARTHLSARHARHACPFSRQLGCAFRRLSGSFRKPGHRDLTVAARRPRQADVARDLTLAADLTGLVAVTTAARAPRRRTSSVLAALACGLDGRDAVGPLSGAAALAACARWRTERGARSYDCRSGSSLSVGRNTQRRSGRPVQRESIASHWRSAIWSARFAATLCHAGFPGLKPSVPGSGGTRQSSMTGNCAWGTQLKTSHTNNIHWNGF
jgi:hypothetical protein